MSIIPLNRAGYIRPNVRIGERHKPKPVVTPQEQNTLNQAIVLLNECKNTPDVKDLRLKLSEVVRIARTIWRDREA